MSLNWWVRVESQNQEFLNQMNQIHPDTCVQLYACSKVGDSNMWLERKLPQQICSPTNITWIKWKEMMKLDEFKNVKTSVRCKFNHFGTIKKIPTLLFISEENSFGDSHIMFIEADFNDNNRPPAYQSISKA